MGRFRPSVPRLALLAAIVILSAACAQVDVAFLAADERGGRDNGTPGSDAARAYLLDALRPIAVGAGPGAGDAAFLQPFEGGTNVVAVIEGTDLADEYVMVGAHYDHVTSCEVFDPADTICNGATDNATGTAAVLEIARSIARAPTRRSVIIALWDREEDGLLGARHYVANPLVPLGDTVAYINFDILGANILPGLRTTHFALGAETGGTALAGAVRSAIDDQVLDTLMLSVAFGFSRSDHAAFVGAGVPSVFFSDATGGCYHTTEDETGIVDFDKLAREIATARAVAIAIGNADEAPTFVTTQPRVTFDDAVGIALVYERTRADFHRFPPSLQESLESARDSVWIALEGGRDDFTSTDETRVLSAASQWLSIMTTLACEGHLVAG